MSCQLEPAISSRDTGQRIPWFDRCQLIITWMSNIKGVHSKPRLHVSMAAILRDSTVVVVRTRPRAIPLAMITMRKSTHGFPFVSHIRVAYGAPLLKVVLIFPSRPAMFCSEKLQTKMQNHWLVSSNNIYLWKCQKAWWEEKVRRTSKLW